MEKRLAPTSKERTLVIIKPDAVKRGLIAEVIARFEKMGLKIIALKLVHPSRQHYRLHYPDNRQYLGQLGGKTLKTYKEYGLSPRKDFGTVDKIKIGKEVRKWLVDSMFSGPVVAMVIQGIHAVDNVRMITGPTIPVFAPPGTIRGDFSMDSPAFANMAKRAVNNIIHASGDIKEAEKEIKLWFSPKEIYDYERADEKVIL